jgi:hypothetical protein
LLKWKSDTDFRDFYCNGGFSLRRIDSMLSIINKKVKLIDILKVYPLSGYFRYLFQFLKVFKPKYSKHNEDFFICEFGKILNPIFKIAPFKDSIRFSFERLPSKLYKLNNNQLPFGCHAYKGYEFNTLWKEFIIN